MPSSLVSRNVRVVGRRTSVRLEPVMWQAMADISAREGITIFDFCSRARAARHGSNLTASIRAEIVAYLLAALADAESRLADHAGGQPPSAAHQRRGQDPV